MRTFVFVVRLARREARAGARRVGVFMLSITFGVGALVAIQSFRTDVIRSIRLEARALMGADIRLSADAPIPDSLDTMSDSVRALGAEVADVTTALSMVLSPRTGDVRLLQVKGVAGAWPFYGRPTTRPEGLWGAHLDPGSAIVDPAVLVQLGVEVGDSLVVGEGGVRIVATAEDLPAEVGFQSAVGPRVWISAGDLADAELLVFGSLARHQRFLRLPREVDAADLERSYRQEYRRFDVDLTTANEQARDFTRALDYLGSYLGLVGLAAIVLGGIGVASAVHVYVKEKLTSVAVLRCIGAGQWTVFSAYLLQALALGVAGSTAGVALGVGAQAALPLLLGGAIPVDVETRISPLALVTGFSIGLSVSVIFALGPLLRLRNVPPLRAIRRDFDPGGRRLDPWAVVAYGALVTGFLLLSLAEAPGREEGFAFAAGLLATTAVLWLVAVVASRLTRRWLPAAAPYTVRQGVSNLFRPQNQTVLVTLALGFGVFVVGTLAMVQSSLTASLAFDGGRETPNLLLFDVQTHQVDGVRALLPPPADSAAVVTPMVPATISTIRGLTPRELRQDTTGRRPARWALRRDYRHTYRWELTATETLVDGVWHAPRETRSDEPIGSPLNPARISMEADLARDLGVELGDRVGWSVAGREVSSVVTSLRSVDWEAFSTNFFVVFEPGVLETAPQMAIVLTTIPDDDARAAFQRDLVPAFPNVSAVDLARIREVLGSILEEADAVIRLLALLSALAGAVVLAGALATSHHQRVREGALLRTLGARGRQVRRILFSEFVALGVVAAVSGLLLAIPAAMALVSGVFGIDFVPSPAALVAIGLGVIGLTVLVGIAGSRDVLRRPPLPVLRRSAE